MTLDTTTAYGVTLIIAAIGSVIVQIIAAVASARGRTEVKATAVVAAQQADTAAKKAEEAAKTGAVAVEQNKVIIDQTNGHYADMVALVKQAIEAATAAKQPPVPVILAADGIPRRVRSTDIDPTAAAARNGPSKASE